MRDFILGGSKITADGDCSHEIKRCLFLRRKVMTNLDSILKSRDITLPTKVHLVKDMVFPAVMYGCESWTIKKAERPDPGIKPGSPALQADSLPSEPPWKPLVKKRKRRSKGNIRNPLVSCPHSVLDLHIDASLKSSDRRLITSRDNPFKFLW